MGRGKCKNRGSALQKPLQQSSRHRNTLWACDMRWLVYFSISWWNYLLTLFSKTMCSLSLTRKRAASKKQLCSYKVESYSLTSDCETTAVMWLLHASRWQIHAPAARRQSEHRFPLIFSFLWHAPHFLVDTDHFTLLLKVTRKAGSWTTYLLCFLAVFNIQRLTQLQFLAV